MQMREILCDSLESLLLSNEKIIVIDADLAKANGTYKLRDKFPSRVLDVGAAEQNMACVAAGLSSYGYIPFILSFTAFVTRRICDQLTISIAYAEQNVKIIGTDAGITAELNGGTHMSMEDIGVIRSIPRFLICEPADAFELKCMLPQIVKHKGPIYMRMARKETPVIFDDNYCNDFNLVKAKIVKHGNDATIIAGGIMLYEAIEAGKELEMNYGINCEIINLHTIKPIDSDTILKSIKKTNCVVTCENHNIIGGIRSAVCELLAENLPTHLRSIGINDTFGEVGKLSDLKQKFNMTHCDIVKKVLEVIKLK